MDLSPRNRNNPYGDDKVMAACCLFGMLDTTGSRVGGQDTINAIANMHDRGNGLGGGFAVYGLYPHWPDHYGLHIMFTSQNGRKEVEAKLRHAFHVAHAEEVPTRTARVVDPPVVWRYFVQPREGQVIAQTPDDYVVEQVMEINTGHGEAFVFSSGVNSLWNSETLMSTALSPARRRRSNPWQAVSKSSHQPTLVSR